jgi:hypothetical protein
VTNCGACGTTCSGTTPGCCSGGCADLAVDVANCGACGTACPTPDNATATCAGGSCGFACNAGFGDCHANAPGCETNLNTDITNCGGCGTICPTPTNATPTCSGGACGFTCLTGFGDCDASVAGCETNLLTSVANCGACGNACSAPSNATPTCVSGECGFVCNQGFTECSGACVDIGTDVANCGACDNDCATQAPANSTPTCAGGECGYVCDQGFTDCGGICVDLATDITNCGVCGSVCPSDTTCQSGNCVSNCGRGSTLCGGACVDTKTDPSNCGACGVVCPSGTCQGGNCR